VKYKQVAQNCDAVLNKGFEGIMQHVFKIHVFKNIY